METDESLRAGMHIPRSPLCSDSWGFSEKLLKRYRKLLRLSGHAGRILNKKKHLTFGILDLKYLAFHPWVLIREKRSDHRDFVLNPVSFEPIFLCNKYFPRKPGTKSIPEEKPVHRGIQRDTPISPGISKNTPGEMCRDISGIISHKQLLPFIFKMPFMISFLSYPGKAPDERQPQIPVLSRFEYRNDRNTVMYEINGNEKHSFSPQPLHRPIHGIIPADGVSTIPSYGSWVPYGQMFEPDKILAVYRLVYEHSLPRTSVNQRKTRIQDIIEGIRGRQEGLHPEAKIMGESHLNRGRMTEELLSKNQKSQEYAVSPPSITSLKSDHARTENDTIFQGIIHDRTRRIERDNDVHRRVDQNRDVHRRDDMNGDVQRTDNLNEHIQRWDGLNRQIQRWDAQNTSTPEQDGHMRPMDIPLVYNNFATDPGILNTRTSALLLRPMNTGGVFHERLSNRHASRLSSLSTRIPPASEYHLISGNNSKNEVAGTSNVHGEVPLPLSMEPFEVRRYNPRSPSGPLEHLHEDDFPGRIQRAKTASVELVHMNTTIPQGISAKNRDMEEEERPPSRNGLSAGQMNMDIPHLTEQIYQMFEKKLRIERERRGM